MSLNQLISPVGPEGQQGLLNIKVNDIAVSGNIDVGGNTEFFSDLTVDGNLNVKTDTYLDGIVYNGNKKVLSQKGGNITQGVNFSNISINSSSVIVEKSRVDFSIGLNSPQQNLKYRATFQTTAPAVIDPAQTGYLDIEITDPDFKSTFTALHRGGSCLGELGVGGVSFNGGLYVLITDIADGSFRVRFESAYGQVLPNRIYIFHIDLEFIDTVPS
jgi:hypothetical protein